MSDDEFFTLIALIGGFFSFLSVLGWLFGQLSGPAEQISKNIEVSAAKAAGNLPLQAEKLLERGELHGEKGNQDKAISDYTQALQICRDASEKVGEIICLLKLTAYYNFLGRLKEAKRYGEQALAITENEQEVNLQITVILVLGNVYKSMGQYKKSLDLYQKGRDLTVTTSSKVAEADFIRHIALVHNSTGDSQKAISLLEEALASFDATDMEGYLSKIASTQDLSEIYAKNKMFAKVEEYINKAHALWQKSPIGIYENIPFFVHIQMRNGTTKHLTGNLEGAADTFDSMALLVNNHWSSDRGKLARGELYYCQGIVNIDRSKGHPENQLKESLKVGQKYGDMRLQIKSLTGLGKLYLKKGKKQQAREHLEKALRLIQLSGLVLQEDEVDQLLSQL